MKKNLWLSFQIRIVPLLDFRQTQHSQSYPPSNLSYIEIFCSLPSGWDGAIFGTIGRNKTWISNVVNKGKATSFRVFFLPLQSIWPQSQYTGWCCYGFSRFYGVVMLATRQIDFQFKLVLHMDCLLFMTKETSLHW